MDNHERSLLHNIDRRLARVEERMVDVPEIRRDIHEMREIVATLRVRVAMVSGGIGAIVATAIEIFSKLF